MREKISRCRRGEASQSLASVAGLAQSPQQEFVLCPQNPEKRSWQKNHKNGGLTESRAGEKNELLGQMSERMGRDHYGLERQESQAEKAERVVREESRRW